MRASIRRNLTVYVSLDSFLINLDIVFPGPNKRQISPGNRSHTTIGTTVKLEFKLIREGWSMELILVFLSQLITNLLGIVTRPFTPGLTQAAGGSSQI
jgi:hypothetical protein